MKKLPWAMLMTTAALAVPAAPAIAGEIYTGIGAPGLLLGYAHPLKPGLTLRADVSTIGSFDRNGNREGVNYRGSLRAERAGLFADWFPGGGSFRLVGGLTFNDARMQLDGQGDGSGSITVGSTTYRFDNSQDRFRVDIEMPRTTPYLGIGWGHRGGTAGWGFHADIGLSFGKPKVKIATSGPNLSLVSQADIDRETQELRDAADKVPGLPQLSLGVSYRF